MQTVQRGSECFYCGKNGHWARDCYQKKRDKQSGKRVYHVECDGDDADVSGGADVAKMLPKPPKNL